MQHLKRWGAVYILLILFVGSWVGQLLTQMTSSDFTWPSFFASTFENWQSEWLQLVVQATLLLGAKHVLFRKDAEDLERIESKLDELMRREYGGS